jgi:uncharacterized protein DUF3606
MTDDKSKTGKSDGARINLNERYEVDYWTKRWKITEQQLRDAIKTVGPIVADVARNLGKPN